MSSLSLTLSRRASLFTRFHGPTLRATLSPIAFPSPFIRSPNPLSKRTVSASGRPAYCLTPINPTDLP